MTLHLTSRKSWITLLFAAATASACGGSAQTVSPLGPSAVASVGAFLETGEAADVSGPAGDKGSGGGSGRHDRDDDDDHRGDGDRRNAPAPGNAAAVAELHGIVAGLAGTCPALTFTVAGKPVVTDASTTFDDGRCTDVKNDAFVEVKGVARADGTLLAAKVEIENRDEEDDHDEDEDDDRGDRRGPRDLTMPLEGTVSNFVGACPIVVFQIKGVAVIATDATTFVGGTCQTLRPSTQVIVTGAEVTGPHSRPTLRASKIEITRAH